MALIGGDRNESTSSETQQTALGQGITFATSGAHSDAFRDTTVNSYSTTTDFGAILAGRDTALRGIDAANAASTNAILATERVAADAARRNAEAAAAAIQASRRAAATSDSLSRFAIEQQTGLAAASEANNNRLAGASIEAVGAAYRDSLGAVQDAANVAVVQTARAYDRANTSEAGNVGRDVLKIVAVTVAAITLFIYG